MSKSPVSTLPPSSGHRRSVLFAETAAFGLHTTRAGAQGVLEARPDDVHVLCRHSAGRISTPPGAMSVVFKRIPIGGSAAVFKARPVDMFTEKC